MASDPADATVQSFTRWAAKTPAALSGDPEADARELRLLLGLLRSHLDIDDPAGLARGDIEELLLRVYPRKVTVLDAEDTSGTVPAMRDLLTFLADTGSVTRDDAKRLTRELDEVAPRFTAAVMDPENWGMARAVTQAMLSDGVDLDDQEAVDRWIARRGPRMDTGAVRDEDPFDELGDGAYDDLDLKEALGLPDRLPPVRLPAEYELAAMSRAAPLLGRVRRLAEWAGPGRGVGWDGELTSADTVAAARELGIEVPSETAVQHMRDVPELVRLWDIVLAAGFLEPDETGDKVEPGDALRCWPGGTDEDVLDVWCTALASTLDRPETDAACDERWTGQLDFAGAGGALMVMLFLARGDGEPVSEASDVLREAATADLEPGPARAAWKSWTTAHGDPAEVLLTQLAELGAVWLAADEGEADRVARLTPLGMWAMRDQLTDQGIEIPLLPPAEEMTAADLIAAIDGTGEAEMAAETAAWLELRTADVAVTELLAVAATGGAVDRMLAISVVTRLGATAEPAWRESLARPELRPYAKIALTELAGGTPGISSPPGLEPEAGDIAWVVTDVLAASCRDDPEDLPQQLADAVPAGHEQQVFDVMALSPHPDAGRVLSLIGKHHPDKRVAKAARRSVHQAATRPKGARQ